MTNGTILMRELRKAAKRNLLYILGGTALSGIVAYAVLSRESGV